MKNNSIFFKDINKGWKAAIVNNLYVNGKREENVFVHAKLVHRVEKDDCYYEIMVPTENFKISYVTEDKVSFIDKD